MRLPYPPGAGGHYASASPGNQSLWTATLVTAQCSTPGGANWLAPKYVTAWGLAGPSRLRQRMQALVRRELQNEREMGILRQFAFPSPLRRRPRWSTCPTRSAPQAAPRRASLNA